MDVGFMDFKVPMVRPFGFSFSSFVLGRLSLAARLGLGLSGLHGAKFLGSFTAKGHVPSSQGG